MVSYHQLPIMTLLFFSFFFTVYVYDRNCSRGSAMFGSIIAMIAGRGKERCNFIKSLGPQWSCPSLPQFRRVDLVGEEGPLASSRWSVTGTSFTFLACTGCNWCVGTSTIRSANSTIRSAGTTDNNPIDNRSLSTLPGLVDLYSFDVEEGVARVWSTLRLLRIRSIRTSHRYIGTVSHPWLLAQRVRDLIVGLVVPETRCLCTVFISCSRFPVYTTHNH
jgi:hypothetical protein